MKPIEPGCKCEIINSRLNVGTVVTVLREESPGHHNHLTGEGRVWLTDTKLFRRGYNQDLDYGIVEETYYAPEFYLRRIEGDEGESASDESASDRNDVTTWESMADIFIPEEVLESYD